MKLRRICVQNYRSIVDSDVVDMEERVTVLIGKNEQGKTNFVKALASFNPRTTFSPNDLPNHLRATLEDKNPADIPIVTLWLAPEPADNSRLKPLVRDMESIEEFKITRYYDGHYAYWAIRSGGAETRLEFSTPDITPLIQEIKAQAEGLRTKLTSHASRLSTYTPSHDQATKHIDEFINANFADVPHIDNLIKTFSTTLKGLPGQDQTIQDDIAATLKAIQVRQAEIQKTLEADPARDFQKVVPHFVFHSTLLDKIPNEVSIADFVKDPDGTSKGMLNLCGVAGLTIQRIHDLAAATDTARREAYEDTYNASISGGINEFWTQAKYNLHFRFDKDKLSVSISDNTYARRIAPSDRSDGFQWYLSFYSALLNEVSATDPTVLLLDNPALELHADGQRDIKRFLEEKMPSVTQVIYVTHSPAMIDPYNLEQLRKVELRGDMRGTKVARFSLKSGDEFDLLEPVRSAIGASLVSSLMFNQLNVLVEGAADKPILEGAFAVLHKDIAKRIMINGSVAESKALAPFYQRAGLPFVIYLDADSAGRQMAASLKASGILEENIVDCGAVFAGERPPGDFELEDILSPEFYHRAVLETYPDKLVEMPVTTGKRTRQYEEVYKTNHQIGFSKRRVGETVKKLLLEGKGDDSLGLLEKLTSRILETLQKQTKPQRQENV